MDWLREILKAAGLDDAAIDKIVGEAGKELPKHHMPKDKYNEVAAARTQLEKDVAERDKQIEELGKTAGLSEELKAQIATLQNDNKAAKEQYDADMKALRVDTAIASAINGKVHNEKVVTGLLDKAKLVLGDDGKLVGLEEQLTALKTSDAYLFKDEASGGAGGGQGGQSGFRFGAGGGQGGNPGGGQPSLLDAVSAHFQAKQ